MEIECMDFSKDEFSRKFQNKDKELMRFYQGLDFGKESIDKVIKRKPHSHTEALADIISEDMSRYGLSDAQTENLSKLKSGNRVVIAGQQAGLFMSPSYIMHKIISILSVTKNIKEKFNYDAVPVFWSAGEDHDFEEINHTFIYSKNHRRRRKISYKPNLNVPMSIGFYEYDKKAMHETLEKVVTELGDSVYLKELKQRVAELIDTHTYWTELFHALVHDEFKDDGLLIFNAHLPAVRKLEQPLFKKLLINHGQVDEAFREGQRVFCDTLNIPPTIQTETNVHLFSDSSAERHLMTEKDGVYQLLNEEAAESELLNKIDENPSEFSNNVVTRPLMQEMMFNTLVFLGGGAEVKYWGEIHRVFEVMDVPMPIVMKRMEFVHISERIQKLMDSHGLSFSNRLIEDAALLKEKMVDDEISESFIQTVENMKKETEKMYHQLREVNDKPYMEALINANLEVQRKQMDYLERRYQVEARRKHRTHLNDIDEITECLFPDGALQERKYHPWQYTDYFNCLISLSYTPDLILLKK